MPRVCFPSKLSEELIDLFSAGLSHQSWGITPSRGKRRQRGVFDSCCSRWATAAAVSSIAGSPSSMDLPWPSSSTGRGPSTRELYRERGSGWTGSVIPSTTWSPVWPTSTTGASTVWWWSSSTSTSDRWESRNLLVKVWRKISWNWVSNALVSRYRTELSN